MPRRKSTCWLRCGQASRPRFPSCGIGFSPVSFHVPGVVCGTRSNSRSFTTTSATPASSRNSELKTEVRQSEKMSDSHSDLPFYSLHWADRHQLKAQRAHSYKASTL